jgi:hypothetical protein
MLALLTETRVPDDWFWHLSDMPSLALIGHAVHSERPSTLIETKQLPEALLVIARHDYAIDHSPGH